MTLGGTPMKLPRRQFLHLAAGAAALPAGSRIARAQTYPARPVRIIVPYAPAGGTDILSRIVAQWLSERLGQQFIIENRPGANSNIGTEAVVRAQPDGYTLLAIDSAPAINARLYDKLNFDFIRDTVPVAGLARQPNALLVTPSFPAKTVPDFVAYVKTNPGKVTFASAGNGNITHLAGEIFQLMTGTNMIHVPYRGSGPALTDLIAGQVQIMFQGLLAAIAYVRAGQLRALAVTSATRLEVLPDVPPLNDFVPGYEADDWKGVVAPRNTPPEIIDKLNQEINAGVANPRIKARLADLGATSLPGSPADFGKLIATETGKWAKVIQAVNIKAE
jgi:tripartite-type tricarboxylate transporter receptor subunit TctC